ncbi:hypothetical protein Poly24_11420 [Rosistilla carotiformis]|uniref:Uncharacterized protein n=1 Tax=Rosistilla carotiformis TaxID=2528017 RepID=A0A518JPG8_9BACT|nr:hypothetical protein Poly24_11420 [Rosistilla carotiformis]
MTIVMDTPWQSKAGTKESGHACNVVPQADVATFRERRIGERAFEMPPLKRFRCVFYFEADCSTKIGSMPSTKLISELER